MAEALSIGELVIRIGADARQLEQSLDKNTKGLKDFGKAGEQSAARIETAMRRIVAAFTAGAIAQAIRKTADDILQLGKIADVSGIAVESLSKMKYAASQNGVSFSELSGVITQYNQTVLEMSRDPASKGAQALQMMGLSARTATGEFKSFDQLLPELADKFNSYADGANRSSLFTAVLGDQFKSITPLLRLSSAGLREAGDEAGRMGQVLDKDAIKKAQEFDRNVASMITSIQGLTREFVALAAGPLGTVARGITTIVGAMRDWYNQTSLTTDQLHAELATTQARLAATTLEIERLKTSSTGFIIADSWQLAKATAEAQAFTAAIVDLNNKIAARAMPVDITKPNAPNPISEIRAELDLLIDQLNGLPVLMGQAFAFDAKPFKDALGDLIVAQAQGAVSAQQATRIRLALQRQEQQAMLDTASTAASTLTTMFEGNKTAGIAAGLINTSVGVTKALSASPPPYNFIQAALVAAAGIAQVTAIRSTSQNGGGSVPSVSAGAASTSTESQGGGGAAQPSGTLEVRGLQPGQLLTGEFVRGLMERVEEYRRDGGRVTFA